MSKGRSTLDEFYSRRRISPSRARFRAKLIRRELHDPNSKFNRALQRSIDKIAPPEGAAR